MTLLVIHIACILCPCVQEAVVDGQLAEIARCTNGPKATKNKFLVSHYCIQVIYFLVGIQFCPA